jgi:thiazole synthase ThiGH ThiG subunit
MKSPAEHIPNDDRLRIGDALLDCRLFTGSGKYSAKTAYY